MIILEGPDNVGKTVAAEKLVKMLPKGHYVHYSKPPVDFDYWSGYFKNLNPGVVLDRFHLGAIAYGQIIGSHIPPQPAGHFRNIHKQITSRGGVVVIIYDSDYASYEKRVRSATREEMYTPDQQMLVNRVYQFMAEDGWCHIAHDIASGWPTDADLKLWVEKFL